MHLEGVLFIDMKSASLKKRFEMAGLPSIEESFGLEELLHVLFFKV